MRPLEQQSDTVCLASSVLTVATPCNAHDTVVWIGCAGIKMGYVAAWDNLVHSGEQHQLVVELL